jgi:hypothetical protein
MLVVVEWINSNSGIKIANTIVAEYKTITVIVAIAIAIAERNSV